MKRKSTSDIKKKKTRSLRQDSEAQYAEESSVTIINQDTSLVQISEFVVQDSDSVASHTLQ